MQHYPSDCTYISSTTFDNKDDKECFHISYCSFHINKFLFHINLAKGSSNILVRFANPNEVRTDLDNIFLLGKWERSPLMTLKIGSKVLRSV